MKINGIKNFHNPYILKKNCYFPKFGSFLNPCNKFSNKLNLNTILPEEILREKIISERKVLLEPIKDDKEYLDIVKQMLNSGKINISTLEPEFETWLDFSGYKNVDIELMGLVPYCGLNDVSEEINCWLTGRNTNSAVKPLLPDNDTIKIIKALDYSLEKLDGKYGKYQGTVYRAGYFNPDTDKQYYSASDSIKKAMNFSPFGISDKDVCFSIIKVKNGHNILKFQKETNSLVSGNFAKDEREILIDRKSKFKKIKKDEYTKEDKESIIKIFAYGMGQSFKQASRLVRKHPNLLYSDKITIWEEI